MKTHRLIFFALLFLGAAQGQAQMPTASQAGLNAAMLKLFGSTTAFSSKLHVSMLDKAAKETMSMTMNFALLDRKIRLEVDVNQIKSKELTPATIAPLKQMGMDKMVSIIRPDKRATLVICPSAQAYAEMPMSAEEAADWEKTYKVQKNPLAKETVEGHSCEKKKAVVSDDKGPKLEALVWDAADLKDLPIQMQINQAEAAALMRFREIQLARPDAKQFEAPAGFTKYDSMEKLMQGVTMKMLGGK